jgi:hypothetical protein
MLETAGPRELSERIIQGIASPEIVDVVGIGAGIPSVIGAINLSKNIAKVNIKSTTLDNILIPIYGNQEAVFFELSREPEITPPFIQEFESKEETEKAQLTISVFKGDPVSKITNQILYKLSKFPQVKVIAAGFTMVTAVRAILQVVTSGISKEPVSISAVLATSVSRRDNPSKKISAIQIYLESGHETVYPPRHAEVLAKVIQG